MVNVTKFAIFQGSGNTDKRFKMVAWERFSREKSYLEIGIFLMNTIQHLDAILTPSSPGRSEASVQKELTRARRVSLAKFGSTGSQLLDVNHHLNIPANKIKYHLSIITCVTWRHV